MAVASLGWLAYTVGPLVEWSLAPVSDNTLTDVSIEAGRVSFFYTGVKLRDCPRTALQASWVYGEDSNVPTTLSLSGEPLGNPGAPFAVGEHYHYGPFTADEPPALPVDNNLVLRITAHYKCWTPWTLVAVWTIRVADLEPAA